MFSNVRDASKVALVHLVARLRMGGFRLLDTQFVTAHLAQFGAEELDRSVYKSSLGHAITVPARFLADPDPEDLRAEIRGMADR
jgi:leucyl/phenylalanyl-tRNA--protein transferase